MGTAALADSCIGIKCGCVGDGCLVQQEPAATVEPEEEETAKPAVARHKRHRPARFSERLGASDKPAQIVKNGESFQIRGKSTYRAKARGFTESEPTPPQFLPVVVSPEAKAALAMQEVTARVQVVEADEVNDIDRTSSPPAAPVAEAQPTPAPMAPVPVATTAERPFRVASSDSVTFDSRYAGLLPQANSPTSPAAEPRTWLSRLAWWPTGALARLATTLRHWAN